MTTPRLYLADHQRGTAEFPPAQIAGLSWTDSVTTAPRATVRLTPAFTTPAADLPGQMLIVASGREDRTAPAYGWFDLDGEYSWDGVAHSMGGTIGGDFARRFATGDGSVLDSLTGDILRLSNAGFEPYFDWTKDLAPGEGVHVARLGRSGVAGLLLGALFSVSGLGDLEAILGQFALAAYMRGNFRSGAEEAAVLEVYPRHPVTYVEDDPDGDPTPQYLTGAPFVAAVTQWANGLPAGFGDTPQRLPPVTALANLGRMAWHPSLTIPRLYNAPAGGRRPSFRNRKIDVAYRLLGLEQNLKLYHTGEREPPVHLPPPGQRHRRGHEDCRGTPAVGPAELSGGAPAQEVRC